ncbi:MAG: energy transducer TonB [Verrucomicrobiota bacterium]
MIASSAYSESAPRYTLRSDLYRACLPQAAEDTGRRLIWMNTVCLLFLAGGVLGIAHPPGLVLQKFAADPAAQTVEIREFKQEPQPQQAAPDDEPLPDEPTPPEPVSVPAVVVAPADANVAFAVEVKGPVIISNDPNFAVPPPRETRRSAPAAPAGPRRFDRGGGGAGEGRFTPEPSYPREAQIRRETGAGEFLVTIDATGGITEMKLLSSSGSATLDNAFRQHVRRLWRFRPEDAGDWIIPFEYRLR